MHRLILTLIFSITSIAVISGKDYQTYIDDFCNRTSTKDANVSILFRDLKTNEIIASHRPNHVVPTASTIKILTTATILESLGPDFRFSTYLETDGEIIDGVLHGNLYIRGTGDPTLGSQRVGNANFLPRWAEAIKAAGIHRIAGSIIADAGLYDPAETIPYGWTYEDIGNFYAGGVYPICYRDNIMTIFIQSGSRGSSVPVLSTDPYIPYLELENYLYCGEGRDWLVNGMPYDNHRILSGTIPPDKGRWSIKASIPNPPLLLAQNLTSTLNTYGISTDSAAKYTKIPASQQRRIIYTHQSEPLRNIILETNQESNNMYAEQLFRYLGTQIKTPVLIKDCIDYEKQFWFNRAINLSSAHIYDGSGLSPQDAVSAEQLVNILAYMAQHSTYSTDWLNSLPVSGKNGTLKGFLANTGLDGKIRAKSGTTSRVKAYAGYIEAPDGHTYVFAVMVNNSTNRSKKVRHEIETLLTQMFINK